MFRSKKIGIFLLALFWILTFSMPVSAMQVVPQSNLFYVNDTANLLSKDTEDFIVSTNLKLNNACGAQVVVVTVEDLEGNAIEDYATALFRQYGIGDKEKNNGVLLLLSLNDRTFRVEVGYGLEGALPDAKTGRIQDNYMIPFFAENQWDDGMKNGFIAITEEIITEYGLEHDSILSGSGSSIIPPPEEEDESDVGEIAFLIALAAAAGIGLLIGLFTDEKRLMLGCGLIAVLSVVIGFIVACITGIGWGFSSGLGGGLCMFFGMAVTGKFGGGSTGSSSSSSSRRSSFSSYGSHSSSSGRSYSGGGGRSGGGGSTRKF